MNRGFSNQLRLLFAPGRLAPLPTVWSNCLAGWWLGGGKLYWNLPLLFAGVSALYLGGLYLNDAFNSASDRTAHPNRPVDKNLSALPWRLGVGTLALGILLLLCASKTGGAAALLLCAFLLLYNATNQFLTASPWLMGACRFWIYLVAGAAGAKGLNGWPIFCGLAMALFVTASGYIVRNETIRRPRPWWPFGLLAAPIALAMAMNEAGYRIPAIWVSLALLAWLLFSLRTLFFNPSGAIVGQIPGNLLAGIIIADWLAVAPGCPWWLWTALIALFVAAQLFQRLVPAVWMAPAKWQA